MKRGSGRWLFAALAIALCAGMAPRADAVCEVSDSVTSDVTVIWSEAQWTLGGVPVAGCVTFPGGVTTPPPASTVINCPSPCPDDWHWTATLPDGRVIRADISGIPADVTVCVQLFFSAQYGNLDFDINIPEDYLHVFDASTGQMIYNGYWSTFNAENYGFTYAAAQRCGLVHELATATESSTWGRLKSLYED